MLVERSHLPGLTRAQRLTASEVLAFGRIDSGFDRLIVLNALRHQRFWHDLQLHNYHFFRLCSTPYGIRGFGIYQISNSGGKRSVLNALRHQRFWHIFKAAF